MVATAVLVRAQLDQGVDGSHPCLGQERGVAGSPVGEEGRPAWLRLMIMALAHDTTISAGSRRWHHPAGGPAGLALAGPTPRRPENLSRREAPGQAALPGCLLGMGIMTAPAPSRGSPVRKRAVLLALRYYGTQLFRLRRFTVPGMLLPALGNTCIFYVAPLVVAELAGRLVGAHADRHRRSRCRTCSPSPGCCCSPRSLWRIGCHCLNRLGRSRHREPLRARHGRAAGQGRGVLPRQLRRLADQAGTELRLPVRGVRRHAGVQRGGQPRAAGLRFGGAVAVRPAARGRC